MSTMTQTEHAIAPPQSALTFPIYMDYQASTPVDPIVLETMLPWFNERFGNPHAKYHAFGWRAEEAVETARQQMADVIGAQAKEIIFTSGATEANNLAIKGVAEAFAGSLGPTDRPHHFITVQTEHKCVLECFAYLQKLGHEVTILPVDEQGLISLASLEAALQPNTRLVSVMAVNNEIGVLQPIADIGALCRKHDVYFHCDAAQGFGRIALDVNAMHIDLLSLSSHKIYGPPGIGALYIRRKPRTSVIPQIVGGGQERGMRSGTLATPLIVGLGKAASVAQKCMKEEHERLSGYYQHFLSATVDAHADITLNGDREQRYPGNINMSFNGVEGESMIMSLKKLAVSSGSACASGSSDPSYVLQSINVPRDRAHTSIRFGFGRYTTQAEVDYAITAVTDAFSALKAKHKG